MFKLKPLSKEAVPRALEKAERYRLLNEPAEAESICLDVLSVDPENQEALVALLLARTEQFGEEKSDAMGEAREILPRLRDPYARAYYSGIIFERKGKAQLHRARLGSGALVYDNLRQAMEWYEKAEAIRPSGNDDARLRWNACARILIRRPELRPVPEERPEPTLLE